MSNRGHISVQFMVCSGPYSNKTPAFSRVVTPDEQLPKILAVEVWIWWRFISQHTLTLIFRLAFVRVTTDIRYLQPWPRAARPPNSTMSPFGGASGVRFRSRHPEHDSHLSAGDEVLTLQARSDFSKLASLVVVSAVVATWYLTLSSNVL